MLIHFIRVNSFILVFFQRGVRVCVSVWVCVPVCDREVKKINRPSVWIVFIVFSEPSTSRAKT